MPAHNTRCQVCNHPDLAAIDNAILAGKKHLHIARDFRLGSHVKDTDPKPFQADHKVVGNHIRRCLPKVYQAAVSDAVLTHGAAIANRLRFLDECVDEVITEARRGTPVTSEDGTPYLNPDGTPLTRSDHRMVLNAVREARANAEMLARLSGAAPEEDHAALDAARGALSDPVARNLMTDLEAHLSIQANRAKTV